MLCSFVYLLFTVRKQITYTIGCQIFKSDQGLLCTAALFIIFQGAY